MAQNGAVIVFCSSCKILYFASSVHPKIATGVFYVLSEFHGLMVPRIHGFLVDRLYEVLIL